MDQQQSLPLYDTQGFPTDDLFTDLMKSRKSSIYSETSECSASNSVRTFVPPESTFIGYQPKLQLKKVRCTFCNALFSAGKRSSSSIRLHVACFHPEKLFGAIQLPEILDTIFFDFCQDVLKEELRAAQIIRGGRVTSRNGLKCSNCEQTFTRMYNLKYHCVNSHHEIMAEKVLLLQLKYLEEKSSTSAMLNGFKPTHLPQPMFTATSVELEKQWHTCVNREQEKSIANIPSTASSTIDSTQFPNSNYTFVADEMQIQHHSSEISANSKRTTTTTAKDEFCMPTFPTHQKETESLNMQSNIQYYSTYDSYKVHSTDWLSPPLQSVNCHHNSLVSSQNQVLNQSYNDAAMNQMKQHSPPTWLNLPQVDEQNYLNIQMEVFNSENWSS